jgi:hypothetical protein
MVIAIDSKRRSLPLPYAESYCNFWLLSNGYLLPGFSWTNYVDTSGLPRERLLKQTASFLEETCKDLLVMHEVGVRCHQTSMNVRFLHRTVFDYLSQTEINLSLERQASSHLSKQDFIHDLARLRCVCLLSRSHTSCHQAVEILNEVLSHFMYDKELGVDTSWFSTCESLAITTLQTNCTCFGLGHDLDFSDRYIHAGRTDFLIQYASIMPHGMLASKGSSGGLNLLGEILQATTRRSMTSSVLKFLRHILDYGSRADLPIECWPHAQSENEGRFAPWCARTYWEAWLSDTYIDLNYLMEREKVTETASQENIGDRVSRRRHSAGMVAELLLSHGAEPCCTPCIADHAQEVLCRHMSLHDLLGYIVPPERLVELRILQAACSFHNNRYQLRRDQLMGAIRSFTISERHYMARLADAPHPLADHAEIQAFWEVFEQTNFLDYLIDLRNKSWHNDQCSFCPHRLGGYGLVSWCVICGDMSSKCPDCCSRSPSEPPTLETSCGIPFTNYAVVTKDHFCVTVIQDNAFDYFVVTPEWSGFQELDGGSSQEWSDFRARYGNPKALSLLKAWYAKNPTSQT